MKPSCKGTALLVTLISILTLSIVAGSVLRSLLPRFTSAARTAGWQEAYIAADAGIDMAMDDLNRAAPFLHKASWSGWKTVADLGDTGDSATGAVLEPASIDSGTESGKTKLRYSKKTIVRDNVPMTSTDGIPAMVDVQLTALYPTPGNDNSVWARIRSMGTAAISGASPDAGIDRMDNTLRRLTLLNQRTSLNGDVNLKQTIAAPNASRIIEVLARPVMPFENAITTQLMLSIPTSTSFLVDSYDSSDPNKSTNGLYDVAKRQSNGNIASNGKDENGIPLEGVQVNANGRYIYGDALTNGGTVIGGENVQGEISADFSMTFKPTSAPDTSSFTTASNNQTTFIADGRNYYVPGDQKAIIITTPTTAPVSIIIFVNEDLNVGSGNTSGISVPPNVKAQIYVKGNIDFGNAAINSAPTSSRNATNLLIYGLGPVGSEITSNGNPTIYAGIYAPNYLYTAGQGGGNGQFFGSLVVRNVEFGGGGGTAFHYDEALFELGPIIEFKISRYFEDMRR